MSWYIRLRFSIGGFTNEILVVYNEKIACRTFLYVAYQKVEKRHQNDDEEDQQAARLELLKTQAEDRVAALTEDDDEVSVTRLS